MQQAYINALFDYCPTVIGKKLLPLSLGHSLILEIIGNPFAAGGDITFDSVIALVWVCSQPFRSAVKAIQDIDQANKEIEAWGKESGASLDFNAVAPLIRAYLAHYQAAPAVWEKQIDADYGEEGKAKQGRKSIVPWQYMVAYRLLGKFPEHEIWDMPLCKAVAWQACCLDEAGESNLMPDEAVEMANAIEGE